MQKMHIKKDAKMKNFLNGQNNCIIIGRIEKNGVYVLGIIFLEAM